MSLITEKRDVQDQLINFLIGIGWPYNQRLEREVRLALYRILKDQVVTGSPKVAEERADYKVSGQGRSGIHRLKDVVDNILRMSRLMAA